MEENPAFLAADLAPGDARSAGLNVSPFQVHVVRSNDDPWFDVGYTAMWDEFGARNEVEQRGVLAARLAWDPAIPSRTGVAMLYRMIVVTHGGQFAAVRDHTAIVPLFDSEGLGAVVHLSHVLVAPQFRGSGLAGWLRAWPIQTARLCLRRAGRSADAPITLVGEMEHPLPDYPDRLPRLRAYEKAEFVKIDPAACDYHQPDFRPTAAIDAEGKSRPLPFALIVRRVGRERETAMPGREVRHLVRMLYQMYGTTFRGSEMSPVYAMLERFPADDVAVRLIAPTA